MASETYDYEPFGNTEHSMKQIADAIRHKGYGKDVREAIAEGIGQFDQVKGEVFRRVKAVEDDNAALNQRVDNLSADLSAVAQTRAETDKNLSDKLTTEAQTREEADKGLEQRIARLERYIFDGQPVFVDNLFPPQKSNGSIEVADNGELPSDPDAVVDGEIRDTPTNIFIK